MSFDRHTTPVTAKPPSTCSARTCAGPTPAEIAFDGRLTAGRK
jgi:hypothetical protein